MSSKSGVIQFAIFLIAVYSLIKILKFYDIDVYEYASYIIFWCFLFLSILIMANTDHNKVVSAS